MVYRVKFTSSSLKDLKSIQEYIYENNREAAQKVAETQKADIVNQASVEVAISAFNLSSVFVIFLSINNFQSLL